LFIFCIYLRLWDRYSADVPAGQALNTSAAASLFVVRHPIGHSLQLLADRTTNLTAHASAKAKEVQANAQKSMQLHHICFCADAQ